MSIIAVRKKNVKKAEEILIETGLLDESSELKLNLSLEEPLVDVFGTEPLQQNEQNEIETVDQSLGAYRVMVQLDKNVRNGILKLPISLIPSLKKVQFLQFLSFFS